MSINLHTSGGDFLYFIKSNTILDDSSIYDTLMDSTHQSRIIELLKVLSPDIPELEGLLYLVEQGTLDDTVLQSIEQMVQQAVEQTSDQLLKDKFQKSLEFVAHIRSQEPKANEAELDQLLQSIL